MPTCRHGVGATEEAETRGRRGKDAGPEEDRKTIMLCQVPDAWRRQNVMQDLQFWI